MFRLFVTLMARLGSILEARRNIPGVDCVPSSASRQALLSVYIGENRRSDSTNQRPSSARNCPSTRLPGSVNYKRSSKNSRDIWLASAAASG